MVYKGFLHRILFLDIETAPLHSDYEKLPSFDQLQFEKKTRYQRKDNTSVSDFYRNAGIWAEFGRIICISTACFSKDRNNPKIKLRSFFDDDERKLLLEFKNLLDSEFNSRSHVLCAHNGKEFDYPYLARRMIINDIALPDILDLFGKKPWEVRHLDTMELWKFGDFKHYTSLDLLCSVLDIPSPKKGFSGNEVAKAYHEQGDLDRIIRYCERDTVAVVRVFCRLSGMQRELEGHAGNKES